MFVAHFEAVAQRALTQTSGGDALLTAITGIAHTISEYGLLPEPERSRVISRQLAILIDGLRATSAVTPMPGTEITTDDINTHIRIEAARQTRLAGGG